MNSSIDRIEKAAWFQQNTDVYSVTPLKIQKFLFFYEMFCKVNQEIYDISSLKAYPNGPVFSNTYGDLKYNQYEFTNTINLIDNFENVNKKIADAALFLVNTFTDTEISGLTHQFDLWRSKEDKIKDGRKNISIYDEDITNSDEFKLSNLFVEYSDLAEKGFKVFSILEKIFIINPTDFAMLSKGHNEVIETLSQDPNLDNPVYLELEDGVLLID